MEKRSVGDSGSLAWRRSSSSRIVNRSGSACPAHRPGTATMKKNAGTRRRSRLLRAALRRGTEAESQTAKFLGRKIPAERLVVRGAVDVAMEPLERIRVQ